MTKQQDIPSLVLTYFLDISRSYRRTADAYSAKNPFLIIDNRNCFHTKKIVNLLNHFSKFHIMDINLWMGTVKKIQWLAWISAVIFKKLNVSFSIKKFFKVQQPESVKEVITLLSYTVKNNRIKRLYLYIQVSISWKIRQIWFSL